MWHGGERPIIGRRVERRRLVRLIEGCLDGEGGGLLLTGDTGIGKTALLRYAEERAAGLRVLRADGVPSEETLAYGAVHRVVRALAGGLPRLPPSSREVLERLLVRRASPPRERLPVAVAALGLLARAAAMRPILVLADDLGSVDAESRYVLGFVARRISTERVALLAATDGDAAALLPGVPELPLGGMDEEDCLRLVAQSGSSPVAPAVCEVLVHAADGNPLLLLEMLRTLTPAQLSQPSLLPDPLPPGPRIARARLARLRDLPEDCRRLVVLLAAEPRLDPAALFHVARVAGMDPAALEPAVDAGLVMLSATAVFFRRPELRRIVYHGVDLAERHQAHETLARAFGETGDERRYWHRAALHPGPDDEIADVLAAQGAAARRRGEQPYAAALLARSAELTTDDARRGDRLADAAECHGRAGRPRRAVRLLERAAPLVAPDRPALRGRIAYLRGVFALRYAGAADACDTLLGAADDLVAADRPLAVKALVAAGEAGLHMGDAALAADAGRRLLAVLDGGPGAEDQRFAADFLLGVAGAFGERLPAAMARLRRMLDEAGRVTDPELLTWGSYGAIFTAADVRARALAHRAVALARADGDTATAARAMQYLAYAECWVNGPSAAALTATEGLRLARETGQLGCARNLMGMTMLSAGLSGDPEPCDAYAHRVVDEAAEHGLGLASALGLWGLAQLDLARGDWNAAAARLHHLARRPTGHPGIATEAVPTYVEAAVRAGHRRRAESATAVFVRWADAVGDGWPMALAARCRALLATGDPEEHFRHALHLHRTGDREIERARTELLYGEYLSRGRRRGAARPHLREAADIFQRHGARLWLERARAELRASGDDLGGPAPSAPAPGGGTVDTSADLTARQHQIVLLVAAGATNREVAAQLSLSPRTVDYHLRRVFGRLGITSRAELIRRYAPASGAGSAL